MRYCPKCDIWMKGACHHISTRYKEPMRRFYADASEAAGHRVDSIGQVDKLQRDGVMYEVGRDKPRGRR